jgi:tetratricopeptide (TPR) repeat protein
MDMSDVRGNSHAYGQAISIDPHDAAMNNVLAMYFLRLKLYDKAISAFERCMVETVDYSETFFYAALCQLRGKKAFLAAKTDIEKAEEYIAAAIVIEPKAIYHYFWAYLKYDYYERNFFNTAPTYQELLSEANGIGLSPYDVEQLYEILNVVRPKVL